MRYKREDYANTQAKLRVNVNDLPEPNGPPVPSDILRSDKWMARAIISSSDVYFRDRYPSSASSGEAELELREAIAHVGRVIMMLYKCNK